MKILEFNQKMMKFKKIIRFLKKLTKIQPGERSALEKLGKEMDDQNGAIVSESWLRAKITDMM